MLTKHAIKRLQQRGIPANIVDLLLNFGKIDSGHKGADVYFFDKAGKQCAKHNLHQAGVKQVDHHLNSYLVVSGDGSVITAGHRTKRINRH